MGRGQFFLLEQFPSPMSFKVTLEWDGELQQSAPGCSQHALQNHLSHVFYLQLFVQAEEEAEPGQGKKLCKSE